jgi:hypothetical protein
MNFRPPKDRSMWDTWIFPWLDEYHLFFLESAPSPSDRVGHWVGKDLVHWEERPSIPITTGVPGDWNEHGGILTGMVVHDQGRFYLYVGAMPQRAQQNGLFISEDLDTWTPHPGNPVMVAAGPHYLDRVVPSLFHDQLDFRDPFIWYRPEDGKYHALLHGRLPVWDHGHTGAVFAHMRSSDLVNWEHLPPFDAPTGLYEKTEVPDLFELDGKHYLLFTTRSRGGIRLQTDGRQNADGSFYFMSDSWDGPFRRPENFLVAGAEKGVPGPYCARTIAVGDDRVLYHHLTGRRPALGSPKKVRTRPDGTLLLEYLPLLKSLEREVVTESSTPLPGFSCQDWGDWKQSGDVVTGKATSVGSSCRIMQGMADLHFSCDIRFSTAWGAGIALRVSEGEGVWLFLDRTADRIQVGRASYRPYCGWSELSGGDTARWVMEPNRGYQLRCFARDEHFEFYIDDRWVAALAPDQVASSGDVELFVERGEVSFSNIRVATIEPFPW